MSDMRKLIKIVEGVDPIEAEKRRGPKKKEKPVEENADADDMYGDSSELDTFGRQDGQEFTDRGRGNVKPRHGMDARFADNPMGDEQLDEFAPGLNDPGFTPDASQLDQLHTQLNRVGYSDQAIEQGVQFTDEGKKKIAAIMGISPDEVEMLVASLIQKVRDDSNRDTDALIDDYYSFMGEGVDVTMVINVLGERRWVDPEDLEDKKVTKSRDTQRKQERDLKKTEIDEKAPPGKKAEHFITSNKADFKKRYGDRWEEVLYATAWKQFGESAKPLDALRKAVANGKPIDWNKIAPPPYSLAVRNQDAAEEKRVKSKKNIPDPKLTRGSIGKRVLDTTQNINPKKTTKKSDKNKDKNVSEGKKRPFDLGVMTERFSFERDALNNVTIRDSETGKEKFIRGARATQLLAQLDRVKNNEETQGLLAPLMERAMNSEGNNDYMAEIEASAGTYNFPWEYGDKHGFATAMYRTSDVEPVLRLESVRDQDGEEIEHVDSDMHDELIQQAKRFIPNA